MEKGILLIAFGKAGYAYMAYNMALSIRKTTPNLPITLVSDGIHKVLGEKKEVFDLIVPIKRTGNAGLDKLQMFDLSPFDHTLYLDVDGCALKDINPWMDACIDDGRPVIADVCGEGGINDEISYQFWTKNWSIFAWWRLPKTGKIQTTQTSSLYFTKEGAAAMSAAVAKYGHFPKGMLVNKWGNATPDELIVTGCAAKLGMDLTPPEPAKRPVFFGHKVKNGYDLSKITENHYILSLYGGDSLVKLRYKQMYDRWMNACGKFYQRSSFYGDKHVNR